jgi:ABC-type phosphate transport system substrate-binding protein
MLETKTAHQYDAAWKVIKPTRVTLGWRAAAIIVHPTNPVSTITYRALRDVYVGQSKDWFDVVRAGRQERGAGSKDAGKDSEALALFFGTIHLYGPPADDPISRLVETELGWKQHVKILPRADIGKLIQTVARDPLAMGIVDLSQMPAGEASVKVLAIGPSLPAGPAGGTYSTLPQGYWLSQPVDLWVSAEAGQPAKEFAEFLASGECAATLQRHGLVPKVPAAKKPAAPVAAAAGGKKGK